MVCISEWLVLEKIEAHHPATGEQVASRLVF